jgi:predicted dehydrogenase
VIHRKRPRDSSCRLRVGVVGIGYLGKFHAQKYAALPEIEIVGLVDIVPERAEEWAEKLGTRAFPHHRPLLGEVDAVSVVVPTEHHHRVAKDFLQAGCDVLLEKPIAADLGEADDLIATARKAGSILQTGHVERFNPAILAVGGRIKCPRFIECHRLTSFRNRGTDVDVVLDLMIHDLDILLSWVGTKVVHLHAAGVSLLTGKTDMANARVEFDGGCVANITASRVSGEDRRRIQVFQPDSILCADLGAKKVTLHRKVPDPEPGKPNFFSEEIPVPAGDALEMEIRAFIRSSRERSEPAVTGEDGREALASALAIQERIQVNQENSAAVALSAAPKDPL